MNGDKNIRVSGNLHQKISEIANKEGDGIRRTTEKLLEYSIRKYYQNELLEVSQMEIIMNNRMIKFEEQINKNTERLAALMARIGIDNSMGLMGLITLLEKLLKADQKEIQKELRKRGVLYFTTAVNEDKANKRDKESK